MIVIILLVLILLAILCPGVVRALFSLLAILLLVFAIMVIHAWPH
jgi:hypothetical protein